LAQKKANLVPRSFLVYLGVRSIFSRNTIAYNRKNKQIDSNSQHHTNTAWVRARLCKLQKGCTRLAVARDKVYQLLAHGQWFSPGTPVSSTTKTGRRDIAETLLKVALNTINQM
jgi:hypothetical protein